MPAEPLPIDEVLPAVQRALADCGAVVLMAPPGSGKTTRVPPALLRGAAAGSIVVLEPRRLAARAAAARVAEELGTQVGGLVGYQVRGDVRVGPATRIRFVTEGVLVRQLAQDPFLEGVAVVCLDEFHERHIEGDLALAMLAETRATVRPDLGLCVMSATLDPARLLAFLPGAATVAADGRLFPVLVVHLGRAADAPLETAVRDAVDRALDETPGDVLVFLPGTGEIQRCADALANLARRRGVLVLPLHGRLDLGDQDRAIRRQPQRKVVLSTNVAESSLTIAGTSAVVDTGLVRSLHFDRGHGADVLRLERISLASAAQRAGRAGRTGPGICYRLWSSAEERGMPERPTPDVQRVDLCGPALLVRAFAGRSPLEFGWFEAPPPAALQAADRLLLELGAIEPDSGRLRPLGRELLAMPLHPRLGAVVRRGQKLGCAVAAATAATLVADVEQLGRDDGCDLIAATEAFLLAEQRGFGAALCAEFGSGPAAARALLQSRNRLLGRRDSAGDGGGRDTGLLPRCLLAGYPDRVVRRGAAAAPRHATMVGGRGVELPAAADGHELLIAVRLHEHGRQQRSRATVTAAIGLADLEAEAPAALRDEVSAELDAAAGRVVAVRALCYRDLVLRSSRGGELPPGVAAGLLLPLLTADPWRWLGEQRDLRRLCDRLRWLAQRMPELGLPAGDVADVAAAAIELLGDGADLRALRDADVAALLASRLDPAQRRALQQFAPDRIELPSGRAAPVDYAAAAGPTIAARLQEFFGLAAVQALAGGRVPVVLELLAPNHRPVQVTTDLASFWANVYPQVRRELSRRYPRHSWPEDPLGAAAEQRPKPRRR